MTLAKVKRIVISVVGFTVLLIGIILIVFPGPAFIVIPIGLAILATEYVWAKNLLEKVKIGIKKHSTKRESETKNYYCPHHKKKLVLREAKHGINAGTKFWGCPTWSKTACNYTIPYKTPEPTLREKLSLKIRNKNGKISPFRIAGMILMMPLYILGILVASSNKVFSDIRKKRL